MSDKKDRTAKLAGAAGGTVLTAGYYKSARDNAMVKDWDDARKAYNKKIGTGKQRLTGESLAKAKEDWEIKQAKKHGVIRSEYESTSKRAKKPKGVRGKYVLDKKGNPIRKGGKLVRKNSRLSMLLKTLPATERAKLPRMLLNLPRFR